MKNWLGLFFAVVLILPVRAEEQKIVSLDNPVLQEVYYTMYEKQVRTEIEKALIDRGIDSKEAILTVAFLKAQIDMLAVKKNVMSCFKRKNLGFGYANLKRDDITDCFYEYKEQLDVANMKAGNTENAAKEMLVAGYFVPKYQDVKGDDRAKILAILKNIAVNLTISRMDVQRLYNDILECQSGGEPMEKCVLPINEIFNREFVRAMDELVDYTDLFAWFLLRAENRL